MDKDAVQRSGLQSKAMRFFTNPVVRAIIDIVLPAISSACISIGCMIGIQNRDFPVWIISGSLVAIICAILKVKAVKLEEKNKREIQHLKRQVYILNVCTQLESELARRLRQNNYSFQEMLFVICQGAVNLIDYHFKTDNRQVTVHKRFMEDNKEYASMMAYAPPEADPGTFGKKYPLDNERKPLFVKAMLNHDTEPIIILSKEDMDKAGFILLGESEARERRVEQYLGIPIRIEDDILFVMNIDVSDPKCFDNDKEKARVMVKQVFDPLAKFLKMAYDVENASKSVHTINERDTQKQ